MSLSLIICSSKPNDFNNITSIFHQGACTDTMEYNGKYMLSNNYECSKNLFHYSAENDIKFIYASSASVYGTGENGFSENRENEDPLNVYAFSKFLFDQYVRKHFDSVDNQVVGLRYFNVYGQQENHKGNMASPVYKFHNQLKDEGKTVIMVEHNLDNIDIADRKLVLKNGRLEKFAGSLQ